MYSKTCLKRPLKKKTKIGFQDRLSLNAGQKYCRMLPLQHSAIRSTFIKLPFAIKTFVLSIFEWPLKTCFTVRFNLICNIYDEPSNSASKERVNVQNLKRGRNEFNIICGITRTHPFLKG